MYYKSDSQATSRNGKKKKKKKKKWQQQMQYNTIKTKPCFNVCYKFLINPI